MEEQKASFFSAYAGVPENLRKEIIVVVDGKSYNWDTAYFEIKENQGSELTKKILNTLSAMRLI